MTTILISFSCHLKITYRMKLLIGTDKGLLFGHGMLWDCVLHLYWCKIGSEFESAVWCCKCGELSSEKLSLVSDITLNNAVGIGPL